MTVLIRVPTDEECDATKINDGTKAGIIIIFTYQCLRRPKQHYNRLVGEDTNQ